MNQQFYRSALTPAYRDQLPAGPAPLPSDNLERVAALLGRETSAESLHEKRVALGWIAPSGEPLDWKFWWLRREQRWI